MWRKSIVFLFEKLQSDASDQFNAARALGFASGASCPSGNRSVWSGTQRSRAWRGADRTCGASGHMRSDASDRARSSMDSDRTLGAACPVKR
jgi:hypothetical protein